MPDKILLTLITPARLRDPRALGRLLDALEGSTRTRPTHWGPDERAQNPYDREELVRAVGAVRGDVFIPGVARRKAPRYDGYVSVGADALHYVKLEFGAVTAAADVRLAFTLGRAIAEAVEAEFGIVHPIWKLGERSQSYSASGIVRPTNFARCGPRALCARSWLGPHVRALVTDKRLAASGCAVRETAWGGVEVDLVDDPFAADFETLSGRQAEAMAAVRPSGAFGEYASANDCTAGKRWVPIPVGPRTGAAARA